MAIASTRAAPAATSAWRTALPFVVLLLVAVLLLYRDTLVAMVGIWSHSDTFAHAFLVPPIVAWLIWRQRAALAARVPSPQAWMLAPMAAAGMLWLLGELGGVNAAAQFALVALLVTAVLAVIGLQASRPIWFALGFLFFMVPFGEFLLPQLMSWTAAFTVAALRLSGVPVYSDGLQFVIPSGNWSVVEACSGVRYLIASVMVGTLYAYLNYRSTRRRLAFVAVSFAVPIVANWVRAYLIVMLGHLSDNKLAAGVDHLIYGWVFFGVVMFAMFAIGARWIEAPAADEAGPTDPSQNARRSSNPRTWPVVAAALVVLVWPPLAARSVDTGGDPGPVQLLAPAPASGWQLAPTPQPALTPSFKLASAILEQAYVKDGRTVSLHIAYYRHQDTRRKLVSSENVLVASQDPLWVQTSAGLREIAFGGRGINLRSVRVRSIANASHSLAGGSRVAWQAYWVNGKWTPSDARAKAYAALDKLLGRGDDGAAVVVSTDDDTKGLADAVLEGFMREHSVVLESLLRRASGND